MLGKIALLVLLCVTLAFAQVIPDEYIVILSDDADLHDHLSGVNKTLGSDDQILHIYGDALKGYAGRFSSKVIAHIKSQKGVSSIEENQQAYAYYATQNNAPSWGLGRISLNAKLSSGVPSHYYYPTSAGAGVTVYVIDTGILINHQDFGGRATWGVNQAGDGKNTDCNGHGTHVASTSVGSAYGVAKSASTVAVKVLDCNGSGSNAGVIAGIDWVAGRAGTSVGRCVANLSLGGGASSAVDSAITNLVNKGCIAVVAAGNDNADACSYSPARAAAAITVGSTSNNDHRSSFSNFGSCVDVFAPGSSITAAWWTGTTATNTISGTSMASPHVAGVAAVQLAASGLSGSAANSAVTSLLTSKATLNAVVLTNCLTAACRNSPNRLVFSPYQ